MKSPFVSLILLDELVTLKTASMLSEGGRWPASPKPSHTVRRFRRLGCDAPPFVRSIPGPRPLARVPVRRRDITGAVDNLWTTLSGGPRLYKSAEGLRTVQARLSVDFAFA